MAKNAVELRLSTKETSGVHSLLSIITDNNEIYYLQYDFEDKEFFLNMIKGNNKVGDLRIDPLKEFFEVKPNEPLIFYIGDDGSLIMKKGEELGDAKAKFNIDHKDDVYGDVEPVTFKDLKFLDDLSGKFWQCKKIEVTDDGKPVEALPEDSVVESAEESMEEPKTSEIESSNETKVSSKSDEEVSVVSKAASDSKSSNSKTAAVVGVDSNSSKSSLTSSEAGGIAGATAPIIFGAVAVVLIVGAVLWMKLRNMKAPGGTPPGGSGSRWDDHKGFGKKLGAADDNGAVQWSVTVSGSNGVGFGWYTAFPFQSNNRKSKSISNVIYFAKNYFLDDFKLYNQNENMAASEYMIYGIEMYKLQELCNREAVLLAGFTKEPDISPVFIKLQKYRTAFSCIKLAIDSSFDPALIMFGRDIDKKGHQTWREVANNVFDELSIYDKKNHYNELIGLEAYFKLYNESFTGQPTEDSNREAWYTLSWYLLIFYGCHINGKNVPAHRIKEYSKMLTDLCSSLPNRNAQSQPDSPAPARSYLKAVKNQRQFADADYPEKDSAADAMNEALRRQQSYSQQEYTPQPQQGYPQQGYPQQEYTRQPQQAPREDPGQPLFTAPPRDVAAPQIGNDFSELQNKIEGREDIAFLMIAPESNIGLSDDNVIMRTVPRRQASLADFIYVNELGMLPNPYKFKNCEILNPNNTVLSRCFELRNPDMLRTRIDRVVPARLKYENDKYAVVQNGVIILK